MYGYGDPININRFKKANFLDLGANKIHSSGMNPNNSSRIPKHSFDIALEHRLQTLGLTHSIPFLMPMNRLGSESLRWSSIKAYSKGILRCGELWIFTIAIFWNSIIMRCNS
jgi:hypothetical protein